ncbi:hypothetical protein [Glycomyces tenuis]|uniref:hypothetical protein n=1 Tax=Glycomyces tenuis TaxID=58116 RepID=UPI00040E18E7|nr:hypothetical protein [Glycomyces tenuis]
MTAEIVPGGRSRFGRILLAWRTRLVTAAGAWSCLTVAFGALWTADIVASPLGTNDPRNGEVGSYFDGLEPRQTGLVTAAIGLAGILTAIMLRRAPERRWPAYGATVLGLVLLLIVPDIRVIQNFAYLFFGYTGLWDGGLAAGVVSMAGGFLFVAAAAAQLERGGARLLARHEPRWGKAATYTAAVLALPYPIVRIAWGLGIPLGTSGDSIDAWGWPERVGIVLVFGGLPTIGAILTIGLIRRWGETFPRWIPVLRGRRVPIWFAVVPGLLAAAMLIQMGRMSFGTAQDIMAGEMQLDNWGASLPGVFILPWGLALTAAVYAYAVRRFRHDPVAAAQ